MTDVERFRAMAAATHAALPDEVRELVAALIEGRVKQFVIAVELTDGQVMDGIFMPDEAGANRYAMIGALEVIKRDYMRGEVWSRVEYAEVDPGDGDD